MKILVMRFKYKSRLLTQGKWEINRICALGLDTFNVWTTIWLSNKWFYFMILNCVIIIFIYWIYVSKLRVRLFRCSIYYVSYTVYSAPGMAVCLHLFHILYIIYSYYSSILSMFKYNLYPFFFWTSLNGPTNKFEYSKKKIKKKLFVWYTLFIYSEPNSNLYSYIMFHILCTKKFTIHILYSVCYVPYTAVCWTKHIV